MLETLSLQKKGAYFEGNCDFFLDRHLLVLLFFVWHEFVEFAKRKRCQGEKINAFLEVKIELSEKPLFGAFKYTMLLYKKDPFA